MRDVPEQLRCVNGVAVPAHIVIKNDARPQVVKQYGVNYIIAPSAHKAAEMWLALLEEEE